MGNPRAAWSLILGGLAALTLPVAIFTTRYSDSYDLLHAGLAIPISAAFGITAVILARRARTLARATLGGGDGAKAARAGRQLGILGICLAASAAIAVSVYGLLVAVG